MKILTMASITFEQRIEQNIPLLDQEKLFINLKWTIEKNTKDMNFAINNFFDIANTYNCDIFHKLFNTDNTLDVYVNYYSKNIFWDSQIILDETYETSKYLKDYILYNKKIKNINPDKAVDFDLKMHIRECENYDNTYTENNVKQYAIIMLISSFNNIVIKNGLTGIKEFTDKSPVHMNFAMWYATEYSEYFFLMNYEVSRYYYENSIVPREHILKTVFMPVHPHDDFPFPMQDKYNFALWYHSVGGSFENRFSGLHKELCYIIFSNQRNVDTTAETIEQWIMGYCKDIYPEMAKAIAEISFTNRTNTFAGFVRLNC